MLLKGHVLRFGIMAQVLSDRRFTRHNVGDVQDALRTGNTACCGTLTGGGTKPPLPTPCYPWCCHGLRVAKILWCQVF